MNWRHFRETFWRTVYSIPHLRNQFKAASQSEMKKRFAPFAPKSMQLGDRLKFEIDHMERLDIMGKQTLYDLDNMMIVPPYLNAAF